MPATPNSEAFDLDIAPFFDKHEIVLEETGGYHGISFGSKAAAMNIGGLKHPRTWGPENNGLHIRGNGAHLYPNVYTVPPQSAASAATKAAALTAAGATPEEFIAGLHPIIGYQLAKNCATIAKGADDVHDAVFAYLSGIHSFYGDSLTIDSTCGDYVLIEDVTIHGGGSGCHAGIDLWRSPTPGTQTVEFRNCRWASDLGNGSIAKWAINAWNTNLIVRKGIWDWGEAVEHANYPHGEAATPIPGTELVLSGFLYEDCHIRSVGAEGYRQVRRPYASYYDPNLEPGGWADIWAKYETPDQGTHWHEHKLSMYRRCRIEEYGQPWSYRGGAGFNFSASGGHVIVDQCSALGAPGRKFPAFTSLEENRFFDTNGVAQESAGRIDRGIASMTIRNSCFAFQYYPWEWGNHPMPVVTSENALEVTIENCGIYGHGDVRVKENDAVTIKGCNTNAIRAACEKRYPEIAALPNAKYVSYPGGFHSDITKDLSWSK